MVRSDWHMMAMDKAGDLFWRYGWHGLTAWFAL
jgi:hypothetical protein